MQMLPGETLDQFVARINASAYIPPPEPTGAIQMATKVKVTKGQDFPFPTGGSVQASKYPWDEWFGGDVLLLERSDVDADGKLVPGGTKRDFEVERDAMVGKVKFAARRKYKVVQISKRDAKGEKLVNGLIIKARDMDAAERQAEDELRAEERADRKAKEDEKKAAAANGATTATTPAASGS